MQSFLGLIPWCWHSWRRDMSKQSCSTSVCSCVSTFVKSCHQEAETRLKNLHMITSHTSRDSCTHAHILMHIHTQAVYSPAGTHSHTVWILGMKTAFILWEFCKIVFLRLVQVNTMTCFQVKQGRNPYHLFTLDEDGTHSSPDIVARIDCWNSSWCLCLSWPFVRYNNEINIFHQLQKNTLFKFLKICFVFLFPFTPNSHPHGQQFAGCLGYMYNGLQKNLRFSYFLDYNLSRNLIFCGNLYVKDIYKKVKL